MALQRGSVRMDRAEAELAVMTARNGFGVVGVVGVFIGHNIVQRLGKAGSTVIKVIHVFGIVIGAWTAVTVHCAAVFAAGFGPVVAGVISVDAGIAVKDRSGALAVNHGPIGILDIPRQRGLAVAGVFRGAPDREGRVLPTVVAVKCLMGNDGIDVQLVGAAPGVHPMLGGVTVGRGLGSKGHAGEHGHDHKEGQEKRENTATAVIGMVCFQRNYLHIIDLVGRFSHKKAPWPVCRGVRDVLRWHHQTVEQMLVDHSSSFQICGRPPYPCDFLRLWIDCFCRKTNL